MKIGQYDLYSIETSEFSLDGGAMFGIIPKTLWKEKLSPDRLNRVDMVTRSLLMVTDNRKVLIDTGNGSKWAKKYLDMYNIDFSKYNILSSLKKSGFETDDITDVICTHLHFDHIGGNTFYQNDIIEPTFPNATYWISKDNWALANQPSVKDQGSFISKDWEVLEKNNMIKLVDEQFLDGIDIFFTYGHTNGLMHPIISDSNKKLFYGADIFPTHAHLPVPWVMAYDLHPAKTMSEKSKLLKKMYEEEWILFFEHDPFYQACTIDMKGKYYCIKNIVKISE
jgi:glyoxylase-like metal-dependent hydrolase (beta-lactamase superfamily II)|tara:strand:- start:1339 stop:2181 length:843 start_codon:yes stop_codon:yes gene_type:complete